MNHLLVKKTLVSSVLFLTLILTWCLQNKDDEAIVENNEVIIEQQTWIDQTQVLSWEADEIDVKLEQKVDQLIEDAKLDIENNSWLTEKDVDLINSVINEITESIGTWTN